MEEKENGRKGGKENREKENGTAGEYKKRKMVEQENVRKEIVKCGFWRKLPLFYHVCGAPTQIMKISDFPIYSFTNDLLPSIYTIWLL